MPGTAEPPLILKTKLHPPPVDEGRVARPRLLGAFTEHRMITSRRLRRVAQVVAAAIAIPAGTVRAQDEVPASGSAADLTIDQLESRSWGREDGLPSADVFDLLQSQDGYLWIATDGGLARFDGVKFTVFDQENTSALGSNQVRRLGESRDGTVWAGTKDGGLTAFRPGRHRRAEAIDALAGQTVRALLEDRDGVLWVGTDAGTWRSKGGAFTRVDGAPEKVAAVAEDVEGRLWLGGPAGVVRREGSGFVAPEFDLLGAGEATPEVSLLVAARDGTLWIGTNGHGLFEVDEEVRNRILPNGRIDVLFEDRGGEIWYAGIGGKLKRVRSGESGSEPWLGQGVNCMTQDREGGLWLGSLGSPSGLRQLKAPRAIAFDHIAACLLPNQDGSLWLGSMAGLSHIGSGGGGQITPDQFDLRTRALSLAPGKDSALWIGDRTKWISRWEDGEVTAFVGRDGMRKSPVQAIYEDAQGRVWAGYRDGGAVVLEGERFVEVPTFADLTVHWFAEAADGELYAGTSDGLYRGPERVTDPVLDALPGADFRACFLDEKGDLWLGTQGSGLCRMREGQFLNWRTEDGLPDDRIHAITDDRDGNLWLGSFEEIFFLPKTQLEQFASGTIGILECRDMPRSVGGQRLGMGSPKMARASDGSIWVVRKHDTVRIPPGAIYRNPAFPPVHIEKVLIDGAALDGEETVEFVSGARRLAVHFTAATHFDPESTEFRYQLTGHTNDWIEAGGERVAFFTELPPGDYRFGVMASNGHGVWNETGATLAITVHPRWFETGWFRAVAVLGVFGLGIFLVRVRTASVRRQNAALQAEIEERKKAEGELLQKQQRLTALASELTVAEERERSRIAADLHDDVGQTLALAGVQLARVRKATPDPKLAEQLEDLSGSILNATQSTRHLIFDLSSPSLNELGLAAAISEWLEEEVGNRYGLETVFDHDGVKTPLPDDTRAILYRNVRELITNVVKHAEAQKVSVRMETTSDCVRLEVCDDGTGFVPGGEALRQKSEGGFGLFSIQERMEDLGGTMEIDSKPGKGSTVALTLPFQD